jgi:hypothetical protein
MAAAPANAAGISLFVMHSFTARLPGAGWVAHIDLL